MSLEARSRLAPDVRPASRRISSSLRAALRLAAPCVAGTLLQVAIAGATAVPAGVDSDRPLAAAEDAVIDALVRAVSRDSIDASVIDLEGFVTRRADTPEARRAATWLGARFHASGAESVLVQTWNRTYAPNVVAVRRGAVRPYEVVLVGGHFDSISRQGASAPGADDNASGTACVLECARVFSHVQCERTLQFAAFSAEEFGLFGSNAYAAHLLQSGDSVVAMVNVDMIGYLAPGDRRDLDIISDPESWLRDAAFQAALQHVPDLAVVDGAYSGGANSDHASFLARGIPAIAFFEDGESYSPFIHTPDDVFGQSYNDPTLATLATRAAVALLATLARPMAVPVLVQDLEAELRDTRVVLSWRVPEPSLPHLAGVRVERAARPAGPFLERTPWALAPAAAMRWEDVGVDGEETLWYRLVLESHAGEVAFVGPVAATAGSAPAVTLTAWEPPGGGAVSIRYALGRAASPIRLAVYDARGRRLRLLAAGPRPAGSHAASWDRRDDAGASVTRGVYLVHLEAGASRIARKLVLVHD